MKKRPSKQPIRTNAVEFEFIVSKDFNTRHNKLEQREKKSNFVKGVKIMIF